MVTSDEFPVSRVPLYCALQPEQTIGIGLLSTEPPKWNLNVPHSGFVHVPSPLPESMTGNEGALSIVAASSITRTKGDVSATPSVLSIRIHGGQRPWLHSKKRSTLLPYVGDADDVQLGRRREGCLLLFRLNKNGY